MAMLKHFVSFVLLLLGLTLFELRRPLDVPIETKIFQTNKNVYII